MTFDEFLRQIGRKKGDKILERLHDLAGESAITQQMLQNLFAESHLEEADWDSLATALVTVARGNRETEQVIRDFCRDGRSLKGGFAQMESDVVFGRVMSQERYCNMLVKLGYHSDVDEAKAELRIQIGMSPSKMPTTWTDRAMGRCIMWSTFDSEEKDHPFGLPPPPTPVILCMLGMAPEKGLVLLFAYSLPDGVDPCIPTFCDAYASTLWSRYFRPALPGEPYGRTMPTDTCPVQKGRPEVVHKVIQVRNLVKPLRYAP